MINWLIWQLIHWSLQLYLQLTVCLWTLTGLYSPVSRLLWVRVNWNNITSLRLSSSFQWLNHKLEQSSSFCWSHWSPEPLPDQYTSTHSPECPRGKTPHVCYCSSPLTQHHSDRLSQAGGAAGRSLGSGCIQAPPAASGASAAGSRSLHPGWLMHAVPGSRRMSLPRRSSFWPQLSEGSPPRLLGQLAWTLK